MADAVSISRATSVSRTSRHGSTVSRSQSLIKRSIAPHDLRPSDILIERFTAWKIIVKQLIAYFEGIADIQNNVAREMTKLAGVIQVPFRSGNQFLGEGGLQDIYYGIRDKTRAIADEHANLGRTIDGSIVQHLQKLRVEIKAHIKAVFEASLIQALQSAWSTFSEWRNRMDASIRETYNTLERDMSALPPDREWIAFAAREDHLVDPETPLRDPQNISYPSKEDPSVVPVHIGLLERKKRYTRTYREAYYVLTPAGFLHEFASSDPALADRPLFSLFLPMCTLGPPSAPSAKSHKFHIEERKDGTGSTKTGSFRVLAGLAHGGAGSGRAWAFRGRSHEDMMEWWNDIRMLCARYLVASEQMERSGPVAAAVRAAGYASEEDLEDDEEEGSSVEEEQDAEDEEVYEQAQEMGDEDEAGPPEYSHNAREMEYGANGYPIDKKPRADGTGNDGGITRRPSKRQQEKAPEGRPPHVAAHADDEATHDEREDEPTAEAPADSRFTEAL
ncbi:hypothetical protein WOLCODRAFT_138045 [Wolfiporia cocos MD-104 SS10]|uniref:PH domain-containing protein n=1 Tax=Wolfiporia cocos (strain MD-104) TaxID=742152 RepID=A0A2H3JUY1_WOLCO|nr:hypothetical protein WOLCODRAFT_138045 [Wolfiporia cocos MD-104 SS10]